MPDWCFQSAVQLAKAIKQRKITATALLEQYEERIEQINPGINAIIVRNFDEARKKAKKADQALDQGDYFGPLHGLPITIKDNLEVVGFPCTAGFKGFERNMPQRNADVVTSLEKAGAIVLGKSNLPRFAQDFQTYNELFGQTNNPWDRQKTTGGSSGGSAAAVAAGLTVFDIGNDIGGSIRLPSHFCGVYGHKPTYGIVPVRGMVPPPPGIFNGDYFIRTDIWAVGPIARSPEDLEVVLDILVQPEAPDRSAWSIKLPPARKTSLKDFKVGIWPDDGACPVDRSIVDCIHRVADAVSNAGAKVEEKHPNIEFSKGFELFSYLLNGALAPAAPQKLYDSWITQERELKTARETYQNQQIKGALQRHRDWLLRDVERQLYRQLWKEFFDEFDVLICPAAPVNAFPHDHSSWFERTLAVNNKTYPYANLMGWNGITNSVYLPATVAPVGNDPNGLPVGVQIVGPYLEDKTCLQFAKELQNVIGGYQRPPDRQ